MHKCYRCGSSLIIRMLYDEVTEVACLFCGTLGKRDEFYTRDPAEVLTQEDPAESDPDE